MEPHERFLYPNLRETIFGSAPEYGDKYDLAIFLRRIVLLSATLIRAYFRDKHSEKENMASRTIEKIVRRPYLSIDNAISILSTVQNAGAELDQIGMAELRIADETCADYIDLYEVKSVLQDETGKFFTAVTCRGMLEKVISCLGFLTMTEIENSKDGIFLRFRGECFRIDDLFKYEFCYLYCSLQEVDPLQTTYLPL